MPTSSVRTQLQALLSRISNGLFTTTPRAEREFRKLAAQDQDLFAKTFERLARNDPSLEWKKLSRPQARSAYQVDELWEVKANRKWRLFIGHRNGSVPILGFGHRGESGVFKRER